MATACELMCQPSASRAIELNHQPATISTTIIAAVIHITARVPRSAAWLPTSNTCSWVQSESLSPCMFRAQSISRTATRGRPSRISANRAPYSGSSTHEAVSRVSGSEATMMESAFSAPPVICHSPSCRA